MCRLIAPSGSFVRLQEVRSCVADLKILYPDILRRVLCRGTNNTNHALAERSDEGCILLLSLLCGVPPEVKCFRGSIVKPFTLSIEQLTYVLNVEVRSDRRTLQ